MSAFLSVVLFWDFAALFPLYTVPSLWPPSPSAPSQCTVYTDSVWLWGGGGCWKVQYCGPYSAGVYSLFLTRFRTYKIASPPLPKMTSNYDIKGLVSLKFLRPCFKLFTLIFSDKSVQTLSSERPKLYSEPCFNNFFCKNGLQIGHQYRAASFLKERCCKSSPLTEKTVKIWSMDWTSAHPQVNLSFLRSNFMLI